MNIIKRTLVNSLVGSHLVPNRARSKLLKVLGLSVKTNKIRAKCYFDSTNIEIGNNTFVNYFCQFYPSGVPDGKITIGDNCQIAMNVNFCAITHRIGDMSQRATENEYYPINVGDGCWIGANSVILPGVTIGDGCIIAAGSVVNKDCKPNGLYAGVPAKKIKDLPIDDKIKEII